MKPQWIIRQSPWDPLFSNKEVIVMEVIIILDKAYVAS